jgi:UDP-3-O-[3-hydroxymyristoyl] N-acetylglucosamine deacetylase
LTDFLMEQVRTKTVAREVEIEGTGIHSGLPCRVRVLPQEPGVGIAFRRPGRQPVPATWRTADEDASDRRTVIIGEGCERFEQIEHLMAAFAAMDIADVMVEQEGPEVPFLDGGSAEFMKRLRAAGTEENGGRRPVLQIPEPRALQAHGAMLVAAPDDNLRLSVFVEFPGTIVGCAGFTLAVSEKSFFEEAAPARTFALASDLEKLRAAGLARGGTLENAVVFDHERYYNDQLRFPDEVIRHKIIDLLGDLALLNCRLTGHYWGWRSGHRSHVAFARYLAMEFLDD